ncbi:MAG: divergent polysaccharide deacetylase family protein [Spirochaetia bacterium]|jgi:polysaccharide deacetylase 2 family uncharacterized protein YibQ
MTRFVAILALLGAAAVVTFLVACPPSRAPAAEPVHEPVPPALPRDKPPVAPRPLAGTLPPERPRPEERGMLAVIVDDAGYSLEELQAFLDMPLPLTVAVLPNLPHSTEAARRVLAAGKDLILHCPMEPVGAGNPGPGAIFTGQSPEEIRQLLDADFASVPGAIGMNNHMGSKATADEAVMTAVLGYLKSHGKLFVDSRTTADTAGPRIAESLGMPILQRDVFIDNDVDEEAIVAGFDKGVSEAKSTGTAVAIGHVQNRGVVDILRAAEGNLAAQGVRMTRLPEVLAARERMTVR